MVEAATIRRLLETIEQRLHRLIQARGISVEEYVADHDLQDVVEERVLATLDELDDVRDFVQAVLDSLGDAYPPAADA